MAGTLSTQVARTVTVTCFTLMGLATPSIVVGDVLDLPAGIACEFELQIDITANPNRVSRDFLDKNGNIVRKLTAGKGATLAFTNVATGEELALRPNGSVEHIALNADGTQTWTVTGHNVLILFPTDLPAGPSTTLYVGRLIFTVDTAGVFTLQRFSGRSTDICEALTL